MHAYAGEERDKVPGVQPSRRPFGGSSMMLAARPGEEEEGKIGGLKRSPKIRK
jgi:hypothetical protein